METVKTRRRLRIVHPPRADKKGTRPADAYHRRIEQYAHRIRNTGDANRIIEILDEALRETHALRAVDEFKNAREQVVEAENRIALLKRELETVSALLREDPLTSVLNRRGLAEAYQRESARADRRRAPLSAAIIDLDDFKQLNDAHGHDLGDRALVHIAMLARGGLRPNDVLARLGGEEFAVVLPDTELNHAAVTIQRLQQTLASAPLIGDRVSLKLAFSAGAAQRRPGESLDSLLKRADVALYDAKRAGKNRIEMAS
jgi:diguanylate cyclase